jgi:hypothetical protein
MVAGLDNVLPALSQTWRLPLLVLLLWGCGPAAGRKVAERYQSSAAHYATDYMRDDSLRRATQDAANRKKPGYIVDSILPIEEALRRFRRGLEQPPDTLSGGAPSLKALIGAFVHSLERRDSSALARLLVSRAEFAYLVYPHTPYTKPPYTQDPALVWTRIVLEGSSGARRLWQRFSGRTLGYRGYLCPAPPERQGPNRIWSGCRLLLAPSSEGRASNDSTVVGIRLFGPILERAGRYKFVSLANDL